MNKGEILINFEKKKYGFSGNASVQVCEWDRDAIRGKGHCYKQDFYGADTLSCHQISPTTFWCNNNCVFCWRPKEYMGSKPSNETQNNNVEQMVTELIEKRKKLISGFKGGTNKAKKNFEKALAKKHWAISLSGEPTLYKKLPELIFYLNSLPETETVFLVSNGQNPKMIQALWHTDSLPTQLYVSMIAGNEKTYKKITLNTEKNGWKNYLTSLAMLKLLPCRTVIRLTLIKGLNDSEESVKELAELLEAVQTDFIEIKAYMWIGLSRQRLREENMPTHSYTKSISKKLLKKMSSYKFESEKKESRIVLLKNKESKYKTKIIAR